MAKSPINIKSLLKRLYSLATHPSANKRLGAALAFNNIYRVFRWVRVWRVFVKDTYITIRYITTYFPGA